MSADEKLSAVEFEEKYGRTYDEFNRALSDKRISVPQLQFIYTIPIEARSPSMVKITEAFADKEEKATWDLYVEKNTTEDTINAIKNAVDLGGADLFDIIVEKIPNGIKKLWDALFTTISDGSAEFADRIFEMLINNDLVPEDYRARFRAFYAEQPLVALPLAGTYMLVAFGTFIKSIVGAINLKTEREINKNTLLNIPDFHEFLRTGLWDQETQSKVKTLMSEVGIDPAWYDEFDQAVRTRFGLGEIFTLLWREEIDVNQANELYQKAGYVSTEFNLMKGLAYNLPGIQDLITMAVREAFRDDVAQEFGYDDEYPAEIEQYVEAQGYSGDWLKRYWRAHWTIPSIQQGFEMLHRRVITEGELDTMLRVQDIPSFWREKLLKISYHPYSRVDVRRLYRTGVLDEQQVFDNYLDLGYDNDHALNLTRFTILDARQDEREASKAEVLKAYHADIITERDAGAYLTEMGYDKEAVGLIMAVESNKKEDKLVKRKIRVIERNYLNGVTDAQKAREELSKVGVPTENIKLILDEWDIEIQEDQKVPTKADLAKFLKTGVISMDEYKEQMILLGYSTKYIDWYTATIGAGEDVQ